MTPEPARPHRTAVTPLGRRTRAALLEAGRVVAARDGMSGMSVAAIVKQAGLAKGTFYVHFPDREGFVLALREDFQRRIAEAVGAAVGARPPGRDRLMAGLTAYLDVCFADQAMKALVREARDDGGARAALTEQVEANLRAMGWRDAAQAARLVVAMVADIALAEQEAGAKQHGARRWLRRFVEHS
jgi:AcrR family transcriptional regulator